MMSASVAGGRQQPAMDGGGAPPPVAPAPSQEVRDITDKINKAESYCLNADNKYPWTNLFMGDERLQLRSDTDGE